MCVSLSLCIQDLTKGVCVCVYVLVHECKHVCAHLCVCLCVLLLWSQGQNKKSWKKNEVLTKTLHNVVQLVNVWVPRKQRLPCQHLWQQTAHCPDVHSPEIISATGEKLKTIKCIWSSLIWRSPTFLVNKLSFYVYAVHMLISKCENISFSACLVFNWFNKTKTHSKPCLSPHKLLSLSGTIMLTSAMHDLGLRHYLKWL